LLVDHFLSRLRQRSGKAITGLTREAMGLLLEHPWPGNVRELRGVLEYAFVVAETGLINPSHLPPKLHSREISPPEPPEVKVPVDSDEKTALINALRQAGGNQSQAAALLGVSRVTVWHRMKKYGIDVHKLVTA
jgi:two-component system, NtrC family, response regulator HydG